MCLFFTIGTGVYVNQPFLYPFRIVFTSMSKHFVIQHLNNSGGNVSQSDSSHSYLHGWGSDSSSCVRQTLDLIHLMQKRTRKVSLVWRDFLSPYLNSKTNV